MFISTWYIQHLSCMSEVDLCNLFLSCFQLQYSSPVGEGQAECADYLHRPCPQYLRCFQSKVWKSALQSEKLWQPVCNGEFSSMEYWVILKLTVTILCPGYWTLHHILEQKCSPHENIGQSKLRSDKLLLVWNFAILKLHGNEISFEPCKILLMFCKTCEKDCHW